jgi:hypothetical protein
MRRGFVLLLGLALAGVVGYVLLTMGGSGPTSSPSAAKSRVGEAEGEPSDHIGRESRDALREILRETEREEKR